MMDESIFNLMSLYKWQNSKKIPRYAERHKEFRGGQVLTIHKADVFAGLEGVPTSTSDVGSVSHGGRGGLGKCRNTEKAIQEDA